MVIDDEAAGILPEDTFAMTDHDVTTLTVSKGGLRVYREALHDWRDQR